MLEQFLIFSRGGLILWSLRELENALRGSPIEALIRFCLLEERSGDAAYYYEVPGATYTLKWTFHNELGLVFVAVYHRILHLLYVDEQLSMLKKEFSKIYDPKRTSYNEFRDIYEQLREEVEARAEETKNSIRVKKPLSSKNLPWKQNGSADEATEKKTGDGDKSKCHVSKKGNTKNNHFKRGDEPFKPIVNCIDASSSGAFDVNKLKKLSSKGAKKKDNIISKVPKEELQKKIAKKNRVWNDESPAEVKLDFTDPVKNGEHNISAVTVCEGKSMMDKEEIVSNDSDTDEETGKKGWFTSMFQSIAGKAILEKSDIEPVFEALRDKLVEKNVAREVAVKICESVAASLEGKKLASLTRISSTVQAAMEDAIVRILTPSRSIDILSDIHASKEKGKPYVVVFVGVNGVGKTTNLAKVAYWLLQHKINVMMAACDTFRSAAVEQLRVHACSLQVPLFEKGYGKDPAIVAKEAIQEASRIGSDVVLVDTAGRLQDNEPLMRAMAKLIYVNKPDLVLFVGEALVGNRVVDQFSKFNQKLRDFSPSPDPRLIDGTLLTKFEVDHVKVGAALSIAYISGAPVMFVGCGQYYPDLKKLNVKSIVKTLLS